jgi:rhamnosyltransferase
MTGDQGCAIGEQPRENRMKELTKYIERSGDPKLTFSVIVPTLNAASLWPEFISGLRRQSLKPTAVLVLDSSSKDGTAELARQEGFDVMSIARSEFNHGGTRQAAADVVSPVDVLVYLTQDAVLAHDDALANLIRSFRDPTVGAAFGRQLARVGAGPIEWHARNFNYPAESRLSSLEDKNVRGFKTVFLSNSFAAYRTTALAAVGGFPDNVIVSEETIVSARLLLAGWKTAYVADAMVRHSHSYSFIEEFRRYFDIGVLHASELWLLREFGTVGGEGRRFVQSEWGHLWPCYGYLLPESAIRTVLKLIGYQMGRRVNLISRPLAVRLSQQKGYWQRNASIPLKTRVS